MTETLQKMTRTQAIQKFFSFGDSGRKVETMEFKAFTSQERDELARLCAKELGVEIVDAPS